MAKHTVTIYTAPTCVYCKLAKEYFKQNGIEFKEVNVAQDQQAAMRMVEKSEQTGVPVIEIDDKIIIGFDRDAIKEALA